MTDQPPRNWNWTPPKAMNGVMATMLRLPLLHRAMSSQILLITFTGRKSGKRFTTPVGYLRAGDTVLMLSKRFRSWWHNFESPAPVTLRIEGRNYTGEAQALTDEPTMIPLITQIMEQHPREATIYGVSLQPDGKPEPASIGALAPKVVVIQVKLDA